MSYEAYSQKTRSIKYILCHLESKKQYKIFASLPSNIFVRDVESFVKSVEQDGAYLEQVYSTSLLSGQFYYDNKSGKLFVRMSDDSNPKTKNIFVGFKHFFSNIPVNLPWDLDSGYLVNYDSRINKIGDLKLEIDYENTGIALETDSSIGLQNIDGYFDNIFDTHIWENQSASFYSWSKTLQANEARKIYSGTVKDKSFTDKEFTLNLRDQLNSLSSTVKIKRFSSADGDISPDAVNSIKRIIFGRAKQIPAVGTDKTNDGFNLSGLVSGNADLNLLTGTVSGSAGSSALTGTGTLFSTQIVAGNTIKIVTPLNEFSYKVLLVNSNTSITLTSNISTAFSLAQARNADIENNKIIGTGTDFINQVSPNDVIKVTIDLVDYDFPVSSVDSSTQLTVSEEVTKTFNLLAGKNLPAISYRKKNRKWNLAGHKLHQYQCIITNVLSSVIFEVDDVGDIEGGDYLFISGQTYIVIRVSSNKIQVNQGLPASVVSGGTVIKVPVSRVFLDGSELVVDRDFTVQNTTEALIVLNEKAEFNISAIKNPTISFAFVNGSSFVNILSSDIDLTSSFKPRDWIKARRVDAPDWYEILAVSPTQIILRSSYLGQTFNGSLQLKAPVYAGDGSLVLCDCLGMDYNGEWVRTPSDAVKFILEDIEALEINYPSFDEAKEKCQFELSLFYPQSQSVSVPTSREMITDINKSCFGSLFVNNNFELSYSILNSEKSDDLQTISDDDIISFSVITRNNITNSIALKFKPFTEAKTGADSFSLFEEESVFVNSSSGIKRLLEVNAFVFKESDAETIAQRWLFFRGLTQTVVKVVSKLNLTEKSLNDKMFLSLDRIFKRYGGNDRKKIGIINSITKDGESTIVNFNDLGNIFNRVPSIASDLADDYATALESDVAKWGYIVDNDTNTPDPSSEDELGNNLIG